MEIEARKYWEALGGLSIAQKENERLRGIIQAVTDLYNEVVKDRNALKRELQVERKHTERLAGKLDLARTWIWSARSHLRLGEATESKDRLDLALEAIDATQRDNT